MGDWEDIFGMDYSGDDLIRDLNRSYRAEQRQEREASHKAARNKTYKQAYNTNYFTTSSYWHAINWAKKTGKRFYYNKYTGLYTEAK